VLTLTDSGGGIDPHHLAEVFDPFFTTKPAGTGLGLAIVRKLVEQHGGRVELSPTPGGGHHGRRRHPPGSPSSAESAEKSRSIP
jgi:signal transduction histidine kinase